MLLLYKPFFNSPLTNVKSRAQFMDLFKHILIFLFKTPSEQCKYRSVPSPKPGIKQIQPLLMGCLITFVNRNSTRGI